MEELQLECPICMELYSKNRVPCTITCGHTFCKECTIQIKKGNKFTCPLDKTTHSLTQINTNYDMLNMIEQAGSTLTTLKKEKQKEKEEREKLLKQFEEEKKKAEIVTNELKQKHEEELKKEVTVAVIMAEEKNKKKMERKLRKQEEKIKKRMEKEAKIRKETEDKLKEEEIKRLTKENEKELKKQTDEKEQLQKALQKQAEETALLKEKEQKLKEEAHKDNIKKLEEERKKLEEEKLIFQEKIRREAEMDKERIIKEMEKQMKAKQEMLEKEKEAKINEIQSQEKFKIDVVEAMERAHVKVQEKMRTKKYQPGGNSSDVNRENMQRDNNKVYWAFEGPRNVYKEYFQKYNMIIEKAFNQRKDYASLNGRGIVDFIKWCEVTETGQEIQIKRVNAMGKKAVWKFFNDREWVDLIEDDQFIVEKAWLNKEINCIISNGIYCDFNSLKARIGGKMRPLIRLTDRY
ncbi:hypothetical protein SteCoe_19968 [Stentor coeruleus]|uniref:RING-type domain-containing protein n=1 Tax=Stentor coeruleus TaxID=5963 RepID=A0A1R2BT09_9CILI|nr:hypothetical protein SteCoe_19968 [Stentor coeruleus]